MSTKKTKVAVSRPKKWTKEKLEELETMLINGEITQEEVDEILKDVSPQKLTELLYGEKAVRKDYTNLPKKETDGSCNQDGEIRAENGDILSPVWGVGGVFLDDDYNNLLDTFWNNPFHSKVKKVSVQIVCQNGVKGQKLSNGGIEYSEE